MAAILAGIAQHGILPGDAGKAPEVRGIGELRAAGRYPLVAARPRDEDVAFGDGAHRRFQQGQCRDAVRQTMGQHLRDAPGIGTARPGDRAGGEPARMERRQPRGQERPVAQQIGDHTTALVDSVFQIDPATRVAQRRVTARLKRPSNRLAQYMRQRPHFRDKGHAPAPDLTHSPAPHQHPVARVGPVHPPQLYSSIVPAPVEDVGLGDTIRGQHATRVLRIDGEVGAGADF